MASSISVEIKFNRFPAIAAKVPGATRALVQKTGADVEAGCKVRSRVDTGAMRNGWGFHMTGDTSGEVSNGVEHAIYNEYGTAHMSAQPMAGPAADAERPAFEAGAKALTDGIG